MNGYCSKTVTKKKTSLLRMQRPIVSNNNIVPKHFTRSIRFNSYKWYSQLTALRCITLWQTLSLLHTPQLFLFPTRAPVWTTIFRDYNLNNLVLPALRQFSPASLNREEDLWSQRTFCSWKFIVTVLRNYSILSDFHRSDGLLVFMIKRKIDVLNEVPEKGLVLKMRWILDHAFRKTKKGRLYHLISISHFT